MRLKFGYLIILLFISQLNAQNFNKEVMPHIFIDSSQNNIIKITASVENLTNTNYSLNYELKLIGSNSLQKNNNLLVGERFTLEPFQVLELTSHSIQSSNQEQILLLLIYQKDEIISTARKVLNGPPSPAEKQSYKKMNEGIELIGFVTENTRTKAGKDFYDFFYQKYSLLPEKTEEVVAIDEIISFGRTTRIRVKVNDQVIYQFFAQPRLYFLKEQADKAINQLNKYLQYLENRSEYNTKY